ncbi:MAG: methyltransferase domain-containing protein [Polyangiaceae bacterium]|nr:methyltransferase domain-containing protein [Polyangiaceae bacterium]
MFQRHPWEVARFKFFRRVLEDTHVDNGPLHILDVGSGDAWFANELVMSLAPGSDCACWDIGYDPDRLPDAFQSSYLRATTERPSGQFDLIVLLDVAEHVPDDRAFLADVLENCARPGSYVLFSVPAWPELMCSHDQALHHFRRYRPRQALALLEDAGLRVLGSGGAFHGLILPRAINVLKERVVGPPAHAVAESLEWRGGPVLGKIVEAALAADGAVSRWLARKNRDVPGLSWWALCQK